MFCETGAWKNFLELEEELTLEELSELYEGSIERQNRMMRVIAASQGVDMEEPATSSNIPMSSEAAEQMYANPNNDAALMPGMGIGYVTE